MFIVDLAVIGYGKLMRPPEQSRKIRIEEARRAREDDQIRRLIEAQEIARKRRINGLG